MVSPNKHQQNLVERAIQMFKNHFKAVLVGVNDKFPMNLWDRLLPQTVLTLSMLQLSNAIPTVSAYQYINGAFDYNIMPLVSMGCTVQIHETTAIQGTWAANLTEGWYLCMSN